MNTSSNHSVGWQKVCRNKEMFVNQDIILLGISSYITYFSLSQYGNYGFSWRPTDMQPMSRSPHLADHFNSIAYDVVQKQSKNVRITDGYWMTLPRPDHTQVNIGNRVGQHLVHPGFEVLSVFARRWFMLIILGLCGASFEKCMSCIGGGGDSAEKDAQND